MRNILHDARSYGKVYFMTDRKQCVKNGTHTKANSTKEAPDVMQIGPELVTYIDYTCKTCGTPADREITNRSRL
jgi:hypothetical protein